MNKSNLENALKWIVKILEKNDVPYQVSGGFAAKLYGSKGFRNDEDIDIDMPDRKFNKIIYDIRGFITEGPKRYLDDSFDLNIIFLNYKGRNIDLGGSDNCKIFDKRKAEWVKCETDYTKF